MDYERFDVADSDALASFLTGEDWPFHGQSTLSDRAVRDELEAGKYDGPTTSTFWLTVDGRRIGTVTLQDLGDSTPMFDIRITAAHRGKGHGTAAVRWLTTHLFTNQPEAARVEAVTRQDNAAMRAALRKAGYVKESHYRLAWPSEDGAVRDAVGYAVTRADWQTGTITKPDWHDDPADST